MDDLSVMHGEDETFSPLRCARSDATFIPTEQEQGASNLYQRRVILLSKNRRNVAMLRLRWAMCCRVRNRGNIRFASGTCFQLLRSEQVGQIHPTVRSSTVESNMAKAKKKAVKRGKAKSARSSKDAIVLLKADHRQVEQWFKQFEATGSDDRKKKLAEQVCQALTVHTQIEEEIFYPAFLEATQDKDLHHEAEVEHAGAKKLIAEIKASGPDDDYYDAKMTVLSEMIKHHVKEEEQRGGMFAEAKKSDMDLQVLGEQLAARKKQLMAEA
jgi:hemerythrin superfamily protein